MKKEAIIILGILIIFGAVLASSAEITDNDSDGYNSSIDCNDSDNSTWQSVTLYADNDSDGYGSGNGILQCIGEGNLSGFSNVSGDCNDNDINVWNSITGYADRDSDGYGDNIQVVFCRLNLPSGYVNISGDCFDTNKKIHPGQFERCNNIDDNCDGKIDETYPDKGNLCSVGIGECSNNGIKVCLANPYENATWCNALPKSPSAEICDLKDNDCDNLTDEENVCNLSNTSFVVFMPSQEIFNKKNIQINVSIIPNPGKKAEKISYVDNLPAKSREIILCKNCRDYGYFIRKSINLKDGWHNISFKSIVDSEEKIISRLIFIDSKKPKIYQPSIRKMNYINGSFIVNYDEENLKDVIVLYDDKIAVGENCSSGKNKICEIKVNLSDYDGKNIFYSYVISDLAGNTAQTKNISAEVDITPPKIEEPSYPVIGNYVYFRFNVTEKNFKDISFFDNSDDNPKWKILCSVLKSGICEKEQRLSPGEHNITIRVMDKAGNSLYVDI